MEEGSSVDARSFWTPIYEGSAFLLFEIFAPAFWVDNTLDGGAGRNMVQFLHMSPSRGVFWYRARSLETLDICSSSNEAQMVLGN